MGTEIELVNEGFDIGIRESWEAAIEDVRGSGGAPYPIPAGASEHPLGGLGYLGFAEEVRTRQAELAFQFDYILVCTFTGSTHAGMVVGFAADDRSQRVIGIDASGTPDQTFDQVLRIASHSVELIEFKRAYEGKSLQGLIDLIRSDYFPAGSRVLYAHLGGMPAINGYSYLYRNG